MRRRRGRRSLSGVQPAADLRQAAGVLAPEDRHAALVTGRVDVAAVRADRDPVRLAQRVAVRAAAVGALAAVAVVVRDAADLPQRAGLTVARELRDPVAAAAQQVALAARGDVDVAAVWRHRDGVGAQQRAAGRAALRRVLLIGVLLVEAAGLARKLSEAGCGAGGPRRGASRRQVGDQQNRTAPCSAGALSPRVLPS